VLEAAIAAGCNPVVHVSSVVALLGGTPRGGTLSADSPVGAPFGVYMGTKRDSEIVARDLQVRGHPVVTTYPGSVWGPDDPYLGESSVSALQMARGLVPFTSLGRMQVVDVRDVAAVHAQAMKRHDAPKRYTALGHAVTHADVQRMVCAAAGVKRLNLPAPASMVVTAIPFFWLVARAGVHWADTPDGAWLTWRDNDTDDSGTRRELGVTFRPAQESIRDTVAWLKAAGHLKL